MNDRAISTEVAVVGGGLVGPALALSLAREGFQVALIDRLAEPVRRDPAFDGRGYAIALVSARLLETLELWQGLAPLAQPIRDIRVSEGAGGRTTGWGRLHFDPRETDDGRVGWILEDRWLRRALLDAVAARAAITPIAPATVASAAFDGPRARLTLADGRLVTAVLAVAADGRRSTLAPMAGIARQVFAYRQSGLVAAIAHERPHGGLAHQSFFPGGPFAVLPLPDAEDGTHRSSLVWSERAAVAERLMALDDAGYEAELARRIGPRLGRLRLIAERRAYPLDLTLAETYAVDRCVLVGDAAHGVHPIAGQGFNLGLRDVAALAAVLGEAASRGEDYGQRAVLARYERARRGDNALFALGMDGLNRLFSNANPALGAVRALGLSLVDALPGAKRALMRQAAGLEAPRPSDGP
ncbi:MAG: UbiH/UbiF/VisC/COQ6 family ubiquinone biosynthesis hydroxylase [Pseudomonadota bacterium]